MLVRPLRLSVGPENSTFEVLGESVYVLVAKPGPRGDTRRASHGQMLGGAYRRASSRSHLRPAGRPRVLSSDFRPDGKLDNIVADRLGVEAPTRRPDTIRKRGELWKKLSKALASWI